MNSLTSRLNFAFILSFIIGLGLLFLIKSNFAYVTPFYGWLFGLPVLVILVLIFWGVSNISSTETRISTSILVILLAVLVPLLLFFGNKYPSNYYITPDSKIVLSTFPSDVFIGKSLGSVNDLILKAFDWQQGNKTDASGKVRRFFRLKPDGTILLYDYPVVNQEVLPELDNPTLVKYEEQQIERAITFSDEGDLPKAKEILTNLQNLDSESDMVYRLLREITKQEEKASREDDERITKETNNLSSSPTQIAQETPEVYPVTTIITKETKSLPNKKKPKIKKTRYKPRIEDVEDYDCDCPDDSEYDSEDNYY